MHRAAVVIPARFNSRRFPGKPLATLKGKSLIQHVYEQASAAKLISAVFVATDNERIFDTITGFGGKAFMTSSSHACGTDRVAEAAKHIDCDIIINVPGDEPFIKPEMIDETVRLLDDEKVSMSTLARKIANLEEILSPNVVKVVMDDEGFALYFSRSPIPYYRDEWADLNNITLTSSHVVVFRHIGIYGFKKNALINFSKTRQSELETVERLEQLRAISCGMKIKVKETHYDAFGIDTIDDLKRAEEWLNLYS